MSLLIDKFLAAVGTRPMGIDDWLDSNTAEQRRTVEFKRETYPSNQLWCHLWIHNYKGITLHAKATGDTSGNAFLEALRLIRQGMQ